MSQNRERKGMLISVATILFMIGAFIPSSGGAEASTPVLTYGDAIWYPSMDGGEAVADIHYGVHSNDQSSNAGLGLANVQGQAGPGLGEAVVHAGVYKGFQLAADCNAKITIRMIGGYWGKVWAAGNPIDPFAASHGSLFWYQYVYDVTVSPRQKILEYRIDYIGVSGFIYDSDDTGVRTYDVTNTFIGLAGHTYQAWGIVKADCFADLDAYGNADCWNEQYMTVTGIGVTVSSNHAVTVLLDGFDDGSISPWMVVKTGGTVSLSTSKYVTPPASLQVTKMKTKGEASATARFIGQTEILLVDFYMMSENGGNTNGFEYMLLNGGNGKYNQVTFACKWSCWSVYYDDSWHDICPWQPNTWFHITMTIDVYHGLFDVRIVGGDSYHSGHMEACKLRAGAYKTIDAMKFQAGWVNLGGYTNLWADSVAIYAIWQ